MGRRLLLTGAAGFIGGHVAAAFRETGRWQVVGLDVRQRSEAAVDKWLIHEVVPDRVLPEGADRFDAVVHLAWPVDPATYLDTSANIDALAASSRLVRHLIGDGCARVVVSGTCAEYALGQTAPIAETVPVQPDTLYAACKHAFHLAAAKVCQAAGASLAWGRIFHLYGPREQPGRLLPALAAAVREGREFAASSGAQVRDYLRVEDVGRAFVTLAEAEKVDGAYNICSGVGTTIADLMRTFVAHVPGKGGLRLGAKPDRPWDPPFLVGDCTRLKQIGWRPRFGLADGLADYARILVGTSC